MVVRQLPGWSSLACAGGGECRCFLRVPSGVGRRVLARAGEGNALAASFRRGKVEGKELCSQSGRAFRDGACWVRAGVGRVPHGLDVRVQSRRKRENGDHR